MEKRSVGRPKGSKCSEETKAKMRARWNDARREKMVEAMGEYWTPERREAKREELMKRMEQDHMKGLLATFYISIPDGEITREMFDDLIKEKYAEEAKRELIGLYIKGAN